MWVRSFETIEELRLALLEFQRTYNEQWMLAKYDYRSPAQVRRDFDGLDAGSVEVITFKPLSKNPGALHRRPDAGARSPVFAPDAPAAVTRSGLHAHGAARRPDGGGALWDRRQLLIRGSPGHLR